MYNVEGSMHNRRTRRVGLAAIAVSIRWRGSSPQPTLVSLGRCATYGQAGSMCDLSCVVCFEKNGLCVKKKKRGARLIIRRRLRYMAC